MIGVVLDIIAPWAFAASVLMLAAAIVMVCNTVYYIQEIIRWLKRHCR